MTYIIIITYIFIGFIFSLITQLYIRSDEALDDIDTPVIIISSGLFFPLTILFIIFFMIPNLICKLIDVKKIRKEIKEIKNKICW